MSGILFGHRLGLGLAKSGIGAGIISSEFPIFAQSVRNMLSGGRNVRTVWIGESTFVGGGSRTEGGQSVGYEADSTPRVIANNFAARGLTVRKSNFFGTSGGSSVSVYSGGYEPRVTVGTGWSTGNDAFSHKLMVKSDTGLEEIVFSPEIPINRIEIFLRRTLTGNVSADVLIDAETTPIGTIVASAASPTVIVSQAFTIPLGTHTIRLRRNASGGSGILYFSKMHGSNTNERVIEVFNGAASGRRINEFASQTNQDGTLGMLDVIQPDITIINEIINDAANNTTEANYKAGLQAFIDKAKLYGDVLLVIGNPTGSGSNQPTYAQYMRDVAASSGLQPPVDIPTRWGGTFSSAVALGYMRSTIDTVHPLALGYADIATAIFDRLTNTVSPPVVAAPTNTVAPSISGTPQVGQTLTLANGTWTGSPTFTRQLYADGVAIPGATGSTYVPVSGDVGKSITGIVTGTNGGGSVSATSAGVGPVTASAPTTFSDDFNRADENLEASPNWTLVNGPAAGAVILSNVLRTNTTNTSGSAYRCPDLGSTNHWVEAKIITSNTPYMLACHLTDNANYIGLRRSSGTIQVFKCVSGTLTSIATYSDSFSNTKITRLESDGATIKVYVNTVRLTPATGSETITAGPASTTRQGLVFRQQIENVLDDFMAGTV